MHRTSSTTRISDEFFNSSTSLSGTVDSDELPTYNPLSHVAKKERMRIRSAENAVHLIPVILILCGIILWFFSYPAVDIVNKDGSIVAIARPKHLTVNGKVEVGLEQNKLLTESEQDSEPIKVLHTEWEQEDSNTTKVLLHQKGTNSSESES